MLKYIVKKGLIFLGRRLWQIAGYDKNKAVKIANEIAIDEFAVLLLMARGFDTVEKISSFLLRIDEISDPFLLKDMDKAVDRIKTAVDKYEKITIFGDYDADGVTATALLYSYLDIVGANVTYSIPSRADDGYGLSKELVDKIYEDETDLIITVDNGITAISEAEYIHELGMDLIITDHHRPGGKLPVAVAIIDPHRDDDTSENTALAGVGVAFKLVCALEGDDYNLMLEDYSDIVTIGTIADMVPLVGENRTIVLNGLECINISSKPAINAFKKNAGIAQREITSQNIAFNIAPRINAAGRMGTADRAVKLLLTEDELDAEQLAEEIEKANQLRQQTETDITESVESFLQKNPNRCIDRILVVDGENWHTGVIGIVASRLVEKYSRPAIVISRENDGTARASGRSIEGFSLFDALQAVSEHLIHYGGHTLAAGFSIENDKIELFTKAINAYARTKPQPVPHIELDCKLNPASISTDILNSLSCLQPFGAGNPEPLFGLFNMQITAVNPIGNGRHIRMSVSRDGANLNTVYFGVSQDEIPFVPGDIVDLAVKIDKNEYKGELKTSIQIRDIRPASNDDVALFDSLFLYEKVMRGENLTKAEQRKACPSRGLFSSIFRYVREAGEWKYDLMYLAYRLGLSCDDVCKVKIAIDVLLELSLLKKTEFGGILLPSKIQKADLKSSLLLQKLEYVEN